MTRTRSLVRRALRCAVAAIAVFGAMLSILAFEGRLDGVRERLFGSPPEWESQPNVPRRSPASLPALAASTAYFTLPAPFDADELGALERELVSARDRQRELLVELERRERAIEDREQHCETWEHRLEGAEEALRKHAESLDLRAAELARDLARYDAATIAAERRLALAIAEMEPAAAASTLAAQADPFAAARLFAHLTADRQAAIAAAFSAEQRERFWPAWLEVERARVAARAEERR